MNLDSEASQGVPSEGTPTLTSLLQKLNAPVMRRVCHDCACIRGVRRAPGCACPAPPDSFSKGESTIHKGMCRWAEAPGGGIR